MGQTNEENGLLLNFDEKDKTLLLGAANPPRQTIDKILELCEPSGLDDTCLEKAMPYMEVLAFRLNITPLQAALFSHFVGRGDDDNIWLSEIKETLQCKPVKMLKYQREFDALVERRLLTENSSGAEKKSYAVPADVTEALQTDTDIKIAEPGPLDADGFFSELERIFNRCSNNDWEIHRFVRELNKLLE